MFRKIDQSNILARLIQHLSSWLAKNRGLPIVIGIVLLLASTIIQLFGAGNEDATIQVVELLLQNGGIIIALIGILLMEPLGK
ncbi:MAG: hypothetical protein KC546_09740 [Anaerolineae bacterium]|nr:hypothetical protein [Anaerolineae bacterium]MCA9888646.1 hypothetical protein [Anaerolineae bacterium]MCA9894522.1 hypothetical protein [Anaerolineae bacterium]MCB9459841.1 hypothetical protein [Anaerolineaceae bacterium]